MRKRKDEPIIKSLLDVDFYKFTMGYFVWLLYRTGAIVTYRMKNRTKRVRLAEYIDIGRLREELDHVRKLTIGLTERYYLGGIKAYQELMFSKEFTEFLAQLRLCDYHLEYTQDGQIDLVFRGEWVSVIYWETIALSIVNELYHSKEISDFSQFEMDRLEADGLAKTREKTRLLRQYPELTVSEFGTRRRAFDFFQRRVVEVLKERLPHQFLGTSNVLLAMDYDLLPMGTMAHELYMVIAGLNSQTDESLRASHNLVIQQWQKTYDWALTVALTDTFGTKFFFNDMTSEQAKFWKGLRHDSGDPIVFGERAIQFYQKHGIDPREKLIVFSDGLTVDSIIKIYLHFKGRIKVTFGWGTNLTNDLGFDTLSLVIKAMEVNGVPLVKLSDNLAKAMGDPAAVTRYQRVFEYDATFFEECVY